MARLSDGRAAAAAAAVAAVAVASAVVTRDEPAQPAEPPWRCEAPWSECSPDADWLRRVVARVGHGEPGSTGSALILPYERGWRYLWANPRRGRGGCGAEREWASVGATAVCGGPVRVHWDVQGARVWLEPPARGRLLARLVAATRREPRR